MMNLRKWKSRIIAIFLLDATIIKNMHDMINAITFNVNETVAYSDFQLGCDGVCFNKSSKDNNLRKNLKIIT